VPWTITNKYYVADVYFEVHDVRAWCEDGSGLGDALTRSGSPAIPALIFVWTRGESYRENIKSVAATLARLGLEADVALAVRLSQALGGEDQDQLAEDDGALDEFLSSKGFEFIDAQPSSDQDLYDGIPRLPRVNDALSTIMWPSMRSHSDPARTHVAGATNLLDWATRPHFDSQPTFKSPTQDDMEAFERWLDDDSDVGPPGSSDPWAHATTFMTQGAGTPPAMSFDDDFTVFTSSPVQEKVGPKGIFEVDDGVGDDTLVSESGYSYRTLGSVSDFGDEERQHEDGDKGANSDTQGDEDEDEADLPTQDEIRATSARIFGAAVLTKIDSADMSLPEEAPSYDLASLDLSQVVNTLNGMKAEIAGMPDEKERRKAAARVALGLVYALEREPVGI